MELGGGSIDLEPYYEFARRGVHIVVYFLEQGIYESATDRYRLAYAQTEMLRGRSSLFHDTLCM